MAKQINYPNRKKKDNTPTFEGYVENLQKTYKEYQQAICLYYSSCYINNNGEFYVPDDVKEVGLKLTELTKKLQTLFDRSEYYKDLRDGRE